MCWDRLHANIIVQVNCTFCEQKIQCIFVIKKDKLSGTISPDTGMDVMSCHGFYALSLGQSMCKVQYKLSTF